MEIIVAKTAGFCFGVDRAVEKVYDSINKTDKLYTYGPIIHNVHVVKELEDKGVKVINTIDELEGTDKCSIIIRSHGVSQSEMNELDDKCLNVIDTTCPYVKRIHKIVANHSKNGYKIIIIGNKNHPEVKGIKGWSSSEVYVIENIDDLENNNLNKEEEYCLVAQTTFNYGKYKEIVKELQNNSFRVIINETICSATKERQEEAIEIAKKVNHMIIIGDKHSSNTQKLYQICKNYCKNTYHIETINDLELNVLKDSDIIGITAGASTPKNIIEEVILNVGRTKL